MDTETLAKIDHVQYWIDAYSTPARGPHFSGHGALVAIARDHLELLAENERLRGEVRLHEQLSAGENDLRAENERLRARVADLCGAITSLNHSKQHEVIIGDDVGYFQRKEWVEWILELANAGDK